METTFMTIHNIRPEANVLWASESIVDILGYDPEEITGRSCFDYFHPEEIPFARTVHSRGIRLEKAAVLNYARIRDKNGNWIGCECVFTVVYDVLVACTSIYRGDWKNQRRAAEAPAVRRMFSSSPLDPRYHMLEHLSSKFKTPPEASLREVRAALILNRFTRNLDIMYATNAVSEILGIPPSELVGKSFYECIQENCLPEAIRCLESAKANDSIAYLRFTFRDPRPDHDNSDVDMREATTESSDSDGGVLLWPQPRDNSVPVIQEQAALHQPARLPVRNGREHLPFNRAGTENVNSIAGPQVAPRVGFASPQEVPETVFPSVEGANSRYLEIEAVVSCTSDGLVVIIRRARPMIPSIAPLEARPNISNGFFAAPWGVNPIRPHAYRFNRSPQASETPPGPPSDAFMNSIRDVAVFAWSLAGINGQISDYGRGIPRGEAQPPYLPVWNPEFTQEKTYLPPENQAMQRWGHLDQISRERQPPKDRMSEPALTPVHSSLSMGARALVHHHLVSNMRYFPYEYPLQNRRRDQNSVTTSSTQYTNEGSYATTRSSHTTPRNSVHSIRTDESPGNRRDVASRRGTRNRYRY